MGEAIEIRLVFGEVGSGILVASPVPLGRDWLAHVQQPQTEAEVLAVRRSLARGTPFGTDRWQRLAVKRLGLESTLLPRGRPKMRAKECPLYFAFIVARNNYVRMNSFNAEGRLE